MLKNKREELGSDVRRQSTEYHENGYFQEDEKRIGATVLQTL